MKSAKKDKHQVDTSSANGLQSEFSLFSLSFLLASVTTQKLAQSLRTLRYPRYYFLNLLGSITSQLIPTGPPIHSSILQESHVLRTPGTMKIDRLKSKKSSSDVVICCVCVSLLTILSYITFHIFLFHQPFDCKVLISKLKSCNEDELLVTLKSIKTWSCGKVSLLWHF